MKIQLRTANTLLALLASALLFSFFFYANGKTSSNPTDTSKIEWLTIEELQERVKEKPKKVFIDVYTSWCSWCKVMDKTTFKNSDVAEFANEHFYAVKLNAEGMSTVNFNGKTATERELAAAFNVTGYPTIVLMDEKLEAAFPVPGYRKAKQFKKLLVQFHESSLK